ncbi:MAG: helix-turn-helix domain-containing protein [Melioribacter sp.]|uniref:TetR/AcrR family transcriptional regulator n=1 Tax=Rosettibacter primus TaxID=3111523 RepID=UPI00247CD31D|nr:helix-turn-helix domain-containing protein [Melioribacter sp.]
MNTKDHILRTAFKLFLQKNYKEVTLRDIVRETGLSKGGFYHYFSSKEQLFMEVINTYYFEKMQIDYSKLSHDSLRDFYHDYVKQVKRTMTTLRKELFKSNTPVNINYITILFDAMKLFPDFQNKIKKALREELNEWTNIVKSARRKKEFSSPMTDEQIARMFIYSNDGIALRLLLEGNLKNIDKEMLKLWNNFYKEVKD